MNKKFKTIFFFTLFLFAALIILNVLTESNLQKDGWYSGAIMYFFSFSLFHIGILEKNFSKGTSFVQSHLFLTAMKMILSVLFIITYATIQGEKTDPLFFMWFLTLYLFYTAVLGWLFYSRK